MMCIKNRGYFERASSELGFSYPGSGQSDLNLPKASPEIDPVCSQIFW